MSDQVFPLPFALALLKELKTLRLSSGKTPAELEAELVIGPGWVEEIEAGRVMSDLDAYISCPKARERSIRANTHRILRR